MLRSVRRKCFGNDSLRQQADRLNLAGTGVARGCEVHLRVWRDGRDFPVRQEHQDQCGSDECCACAGEDLREARGTLWLRLLGCAGCEAVKHRRGPRGGFHPEGEEGREGTPPVNE